MNRVRQQGKGSLGSLGLIEAEIIFDIDEWLKILQSENFFTYVPKIYTDIQVVPLEIPSIYRWQTVL